MRSWCDSPPRRPINGTMGPLKESASESEFQGVPVTVIDTQYVSDQQLCLFQATATGAIQIASDLDWKYRGPVVGDCE